VAEVNCALSVNNWNEAVGVPSQLGLDPRAANLLSAVANAGELRHHHECHNAINSNN
jgi:hypothetical protein